MRKLLLTVAALFALFGGTALANYVIKDANGVTQTITSFVCNTTQICPGIVLFDSTGAEKATSANPLIGQVFSTANAPAYGHICGSSAHVFVNTATDTQLVALTAAQTVYICDWEFSASAGEDNHLESATAASCGGTLTGVGNTFYAVTPAKAAPNPFYRGLNGGSGNAICVHTTSTANFDITLYYDKY